MNLFWLLVIDIVSSLPLILIIYLIVRAKKKKRYEQSPEGQQAAAAARRKRQAAELHNFTERSELPKDLELLKEMKSMYDKEGDEHRSLLCLMRMGESGDLEAACDVAEILADEAESPHDWKYIHNYLKPLCNPANKSATAQRICRLSENAEETYEIGMGDQYVSSKDYAKASAHYGNIALRRNHPLASKLFAQSRILSAKTLKDYDLAEQHILKAEKGGQDVSSVKAPILQERRYRYGLDALEKQNIETAVDYFMEAAKLGDPEAAAAGARTVMKHGGSLEDWQLTEKMAQMAAQAGLMDEEEELLITLTSFSKVTEMNSLLQDGYNAYQNGNLTDAVKKLSSASDLGSGPASALLAEILLEHSKTEENLEIAKKYALRAKQLERRSIPNETAELENRIQGEIYCKKAWTADDAKDNKTAISYWKKAAELGHIESAFMAASHLGKNAHTYEDFLEAERFAQILVDHPQAGDGIRDMAKKLVYDYEINGLLAKSHECHNRKDYYNAIFYAKRAYEKGHKPAAFNVAFEIISQKTLYEKDLLEARKYAELARDFAPKESQQILDIVNKAL